MGLLDDAIRDHLDLKRRRGADPGEVERAEREALGPVRRNPTPAELAEAEAAEAGEGAPAYDQAGDEDWAHDSLQEPAADGGAEPAYAEPGVQAPPEFPAPGAAPRRDERDALAEEPFDDEPFEEEPFEDSSRHDRDRDEPTRPRAMSAGPETAEYDVEDALAAEDHRDQRGPGDEDVLEETPEFLQDTPDHDRLWFEQRPPKDFDFDE